MIRFFVAFLFLALSSISYSAIHTYYKAGNVCSFSKEKFCADDLKFKESLYGSSVVVSQISCTANNQYVTLNWQYARKNWIDGSLYDIDSQRYSTSAEVMRQECDGQFTLKADCSTFCGVDPCAPLEGQEVQSLVTCGTASCPSPTVFECSGGSCGCTGGAKTQLIPTPAGSTSVNECSATLKPAQAVPTFAKIKTSAAGSSSTTSYCNATYVYTGTSSQPYDQPTDLASLSFGGVTATTENGQCPTGTVKGQLNNSWVCVAESNKGTNAGCPTGQIKDNQGQCVPFAEAGNGSGSGDGSGGGGGTCTITGQTQVNGSCQCPTGQTVQNNQCVSSDTGSGSGSGTGNGSGSGDGSGGGGGTCTITGQTQVNGSCQCPTGQTVQNGACSGNGSIGSYTGSNKCQQAPVCTGDVVQCGLMAEQYKSKCEMLEQLGGVPDDVKQAANELGEEVTNNQDINGMKQAVTGYMNTLQSLVVPSNSACVISNIQLQILAKTIEIPLSQFCPFFELIRLMLNITIDLIVLRIVSRAVLSAG